MSSHSELQFVPGISASQKAPLSERIEALLAGISFGDKRGAFKPREEEAISQALPLMALAENWVGLVNVASQAVLVRGSFRFEVESYRAWLEALRANFEMESLQSLGKHLLSQRERGSAFVALALIAFTYAGRNSYARVLCKVLKKQESHTQWEVEAIAIYIGESSNKALQRKSVRLQTLLVVEQPSNFWMVRNFLYTSLETDHFEQAALAFQLMHATWPEAAEPYWSAASLAGMEGSWGEAATTLTSLVSSAGATPEASVVLAQCYEMSGDLLAARKILQEKADMFDDGDYEFQITYGCIHFKLHARYNLPAYRMLAVRHLANAAACAPIFGISDAPIHLMLHALRAGVGENIVAGETQKGTEVKYWLLEIDDKTFETLAAKDFGLSSMPQGISQGDTILLARHNQKFKDNNFQVVGWMSVDSPVVQDCLHGPTAMTGVVNPFLTYIPAQFESGVELMNDATGCHNFARQGLAKYYRLSKEAGQGVFLYADKMYANYSQKGAQHAV